MVAVAMIASVALAQDETRVLTVKPQYLPPAELAGILGVRDRGGHDLLEWRTGDMAHSVEVRRHDGANLLILSGPAADVEAVEAMIKAVDMPPRQILLEAKIVEVDRDRATDMGFDWSQITATVGAHASEDVRFQKSVDEFGPGLTFTGRDKTHRRESILRASGDVFGNLRLLEQAGAATFRDAPRILTLNNRRATILDGQRVTYITRYSSYTNLFETDTLDAGLTLSVLPSLGESGYLTLDVTAELTSLSSNISGSPVKDGQIVENTVLVKNGETVLLGGFERTSETRTKRRFPGLGTILPFLFSREIVNKSNRESFVALTARVVDMNAGIDERSRGILQGGTPVERK